MIVWGSKGFSRNLLSGYRVAHCEVCEKDRHYKLALVYKIWGLWWIFNFVTERQYMVVCEICERGWELEADKFEKSIKEDGAKSPIPFMHRYGLLVLIGFIVLCWIFSAIGN